MLRAMQVQDDASLVPRVSLMRQWLGRPTAIRDSIIWSRTRDTCFKLSGHMHVCCRVVLFLENPKLKQGHHDSIIAEHDADVKILAKSDNLMCVYQM